MSAQTNRLNTALSGRYRIIRHLGEGGMATVYLCEDLKHERQVALKPPGTRADDAPLRVRLVVVGNWLREFKTMMGVAK